MPAQLIIDDIHAGYGRSTVLQGIAIQVDAGHSLAVLGHNGAGKTTLLATLAGITQRHAGRIFLGEHELTDAPPYVRARQGLGWVPQDRAVFSGLTVEENLQVVARPGPWKRAAVYDLFPRLAERRRHYGNQLSGGEQQMLAIGRALMLNPRALMLDEPLEGLAPMVAEQLMQMLARLMTARAMTVIIVEQNPQQVLPVTDRAIVLEGGRLVHQAASADLLADPDTLERWLTL